MESYAKNRTSVEVHAVTCSEYAGHEVLTLDEMRELYGLELEAA